MGDRPKVTTSISEQASRKRRSSQVTNPETHQLRSKKTTTEKKQNNPFLFSNQGGTDEENWEDFLYVILFCSGHLKQSCYIFSQSRILIKQTISGQRRRGSSIIYRSHIPCCRATLFARPRDPPIFVHIVVIVVI